MTRLNIGDTAPDAELFTAGGETTHLSSLWDTRPTLLSFLRHFGWIFCRDWLAQLEQHHAQIEKLGFQSIAVAQGKPKHAVRYCGDLAPSIDCLVKPDTVAYETYGLQQSTVKQLASFDVMKAGFKAFARGNMQGKSIGDVMMLPGTFLVDTTGTIRYAFYSSHAGEHPAWDDLTTAMQQITAWQSIESIYRLRCLAEKFYQTAYFISYINEHCRIS